LIEAKPLPPLPGSYVLSLDISETAPAEGRPPKAQAVTLTLQRPEPKLVTSSQLLIDQEYFTWPSHSRASRLRLTEQSKKARLTGVQIVDVRDPSSNVPVDRAMLAVTLTPPTIAAGSVVFPQVQVDGSFPLGTTTGKLEIRADQLATPLTINYEVRAKQTAWWIVLITAAGFLFGWWIRKYLSNRQARAKALAAASRVLEDVRNTLAQIADAEFRAAAQAAQSKLLGARREPKAEKIDEVVAQSIEALASARTALAARRKTVVETLEPLAALARRNWQLPSDSATSGLAQLRAELGEVQSLLDQHDAGRARDRLGLIPTGVLVQLVRDLATWRFEAEKYLAALVRHPPALPARGVEQLRLAAESWKATFAAQAPADTDISLQELTTALDTAHSAYAAARQIAERLVVDSNSLVQWVHAILEPLPLAQGHRLASLEPVTLEASRAVVDELKFPAQNEPHLANREHRLAVDWEGILDSVLPPDANVPAIREALAQRRWTEAGQAAADALRPVVAQRIGGDEAVVETM
jgi:hypothetical protein